MIRITFMSDTHNKHKHIPSKYLPGGDLLIHAGDCSSRGYEHEIREFCKWFNDVPGYTHKLFIAGNHDWGFQDNSIKVAEIVKFYKNITYLQDELYVMGDDYSTAIKIYGSPWQPEFYNWAFNLPKGGWELQQKWDDITEDADIVITHGPAYGYVDMVIGRYEHLGCELLDARLKKIKPSIHVCGHIHSGHGYTSNENTHYINASVLNEQYEFSYVPVTVDWDSATNKLIFVD